MLECVYTLVLLVNHVLDNKPNMNARKNMKRCLNRKANDG